MGVTVGVGVADGGTVGVAVTNGVADGVTVGDDVGSTVADDVAVGADVAVGIGVNDEVTARVTGGVAIGVITSLPPPLLFRCVPIMYTADMTTHVNNNSKIICFILLLAILINKTDFNELS